MRILSNYFIQRKEEKLKSFKYDNSNKVHHEDFSSYQG
jgi:hypothetical protein